MNLIYIFLFQLNSKKFSLYKGTCERNFTEPDIYPIVINHYKSQLLKQLENNQTSILTKLNIIEEYKRLGVID
jgi:hypothetical protein